MWRGCGTTTIDLQCALELGGGLWDNKTIGFTVSGELGGVAVQQKNNDLLCLERGEAVPQKDH